MVREGEGLKWRTYKMTQNVVEVALDKSKYPTTDWIEHGVQTPEFKLEG